MRRFFEERGSLEVETPSIVLSPGVDAHLDAPAVTLRPGGPGGALVQRHLATSPEYAMKRLLAAGSGPIHQIGHAFRDAEVGRLHEPEFTMVEWYRPGADDHALMEETEALIRAVVGLSGGALAYGERRCVMGTEPFPRQTFRQAMLAHAGVDPDVDDDARLGRVLRAAGLRPPKGTTREELVDLVLALVVQPQLGAERPEFVVDWPTDRAALARTRTTAEGEVAARFELYACGVELCNGYFELCDPVEQRARIASENARRLTLGKESYPVDEAFLGALETGLPDCAGNALGLDRLVLLVAAAAGLPVTEIGHVRAFRVDVDPASLRS